MQEKNEMGVGSPERLSGQRLAYPYRALTPHICGCSCNQEIKKGEEYYQVFSIDGTKRHFVAYIKAECFSEYKIQSSREVNSKK